MHISGSLQLAACALAGGAVAIPGAAALAAPSPHNVKITDCGKALTRPKTVTLACADAGVVLSKLSWSSFGGNTARAKGQISINTCEPNCAAGATKTYPVLVAASKPKACKRAVSVYRHIALTFTGAKPSNAREFTGYKLTCPS